MKLINKFKSENKKFIDTHIKNYQTKQAGRKRNRKTIIFAYFKLLVFLKYNSKKSQKKSSHKVEKNAH